MGKERVIVNLLVKVFVVAILICVAFEVEASDENVAETREEVASVVAKPTGKLSEILSTIKEASVGGVSQASTWVRSLPFGKIFMTGGALLSLFFIFVRLVIVLGPILILGALTRESTDTGDFLRMLLEFYGQIIEAADPPSGQV